MRPGVLETRTGRFFWIVTEYPRLIVACSITVGQAFEERTPKKEIDCKSQHRSKRRWAPLNPLGSS